MYKRKTKIRLSYSTMNELVNCPHTWLCKQMGLQRRTTQAMLEGRAAHRVIQDHVAGLFQHPLLADLPPFSVVETTDFDAATKVELPINDQYEFIGYLDGLQPNKGEMLEIKTGKSWSMGDFAKLVQWKLYALALPEYTKAWFVNTPRLETDWTPGTVKVFNAQITASDRARATEFISSALTLIDNIEDAVKATTDGSRSRWCNYIDCPYCGEENKWKS